MLVFWGILIFCIGALIGVLIGWTNARENIREKLIRELGRAELENKSLESIIRTLSPRAGIQVVSYSSKKEEGGEKK